jgi:hypothetical protein
MTREMRLADVRFTSDFKLHKANVASFDLANLDKDRRMDLEGVDTVWIVVGLVAAGVPARRLLRRRRRRQLELSLFRPASSGAGRPSPRSGPIVPRRIDR